MKTAVDTLDHGFYVRTPEQRSDYARHTLELIDLMPSASLEVISRQADRRMQREFLSELGRIADQRVAASIIVDEVHPHSDVDLEERRVQILDELQQELTVLHYALPPIDHVKGPKA